MLISSYNKSTQLGLGLSEFIISIALSMAAITAVISIYITSFSIDTKTIRYSRLVDEVNSLQVLITEDIKRAGYVANADELITTTVAGNVSSCLPDAARCSNVAFRDIEVSKFGSEEENSCILFAYDLDDDGQLDLGSAGAGTTSQTHEAFGYRLNDGAIETRQAGALCTEGGWEDLTNNSFVTISELVFTCQKEALNVDGSKTLDADGNVVIEACTSANLPPPAPNGGSTIITVNISFTATLVEDTSFSLTTSETVTVRNAFYN